MLDSFWNFGDIILMRTRIMCKKNCQKKELNEWIINWPSKVFLRKEKLCFTSFGASKKDKLFEIVCLIEFVGEISLFPFIFLNYSPKHVSNIPMKQKMIFFWVLEVLATQFFSAFWLSSTLFHPPTIVVVPQSSPLLLVLLEPKF